MRPGILQAFVVVVAFTGAFTTGCDSWDAYKITGTVTDSVGRPLGGIAVPHSGQPSLGEKPIQDL